MEKFKDYIENELIVDKKSMIAIFSLVIVISGMFGWLYEFIFYYFNSNMEYFSFQGGNFLPWINIYATGAILVYILTFKYRKKPLKVFLIGSVSCGLLEYFSGLMIYELGNGARYWDYNTEIWNFLNIQGFVCLRSVLLFGVFSLLLIYVVFPLLLYVSKMINAKVFFIVAIVLVTIVLIDEFYNLIFAHLLGLPTAIEIYKQMGLNYIRFF